MNKELVKIRSNGEYFNTGNVLYDEVSYDMENIIIREMNNLEFPKWYSEYIKDCEKKMYDMNYKNMNKITSLIESSDLGLLNKIEIGHVEYDDKRIYIKGKIRYIKSWRDKVHPLEFLKDKKLNVSGYESKFKVSEKEFHVQYTLTEEKIDELYKMNDEDRTHMNQLLEGLGQKFFDAIYITYESGLTLSGLIYDYMLGKSKFDDVLKSLIKLVEIEKEYRKEYYEKIKKQIGVK